MKLNVFVFGFVFYGVGVSAAPIYLDCNVSNKTENKSFSIKLDEASGKITHTNQSGGVFNAEGFFAANSIKYQDVITWDGVKIVLQYDINRTSLAVVETSVVGPLDPGYNDKVPTTTDKMAGVCKVQKVDERKI